MNHLRTSFILNLGFLACCIFALISCLANVETETLPGDVPPPKTNPPISSDIPSRETLPPKVTDSSSNSPWISSNMPVENIEGSVSIREFREQYKKKGSPKIMIFLNRELSADVREWSRESQLKIEARTSYRSQTNAGSSSKQKDQEVVAGVDKRISLSEPRVYPGEKWMWAFEDGFMFPFLEANARLIDYATIIRLEGADHLAASAALEISNTKKLEMEALRKYVDILIEILVQEDSESMIGYLFKASAKELKTGQLLANTTIMNIYDMKEELVNRITATSKGYGIETDLFPSVSKVSERLALAVMSQIIYQWK